MREARRMVLAWQSYRVFVAPCLPVRWWDLGRYGRGYVVLAWRYV